MCKRKFPFMKSYAAALVLLCLCSTLGAAVREQKEESASTRLVLTRPADGGAFADPLRGLRKQADDQRPFEWKEIDEKIDTWFAEAATCFPEQHKKHASNWTDLREQSKRDARVTLAALEQTWKDSIGKTVTAFETSEAEFYASRPTLQIRGSYHYFEGQRNPSAINPSWHLASASSNGLAQIRGGDNYNSGEITLKAAGLDLAMFSLRTVWEMWLEAAIDPASLRATACGAINTPTISVWLCPRFTGKSNRKLTSTWRTYDKGSNPTGLLSVRLGDTTITTTSEIGLGFAYEALDSKAPMPALIAGKEDALLPD